MTHAELAAVTDPAVIESLSLKQVLALFEGADKTVTPVVKGNKEKPTTTELLGRTVSLSYLRRQ